MVVGFFEGGFALFDVFPWGVWGALVEAGWLGGAGAGLVGTEPDPLGRIGMGLGPALGGGLFRDGVPPPPAVVPAVLLGGASWVGGWLGRLGPRAGGGDMGWEGVGTPVGFCHVATL